MNIDISTIKKLSEKLTRPLVIWDTETGGTSDDSEIVQMGFVKIHPNGEVFTLNFLCKPEKPIPQASIDIHGITNEQLEKEFPFESFIPEIVEMFKNSDHSGYNVKFDARLLDFHFKKRGLPSPLVGCQIYDAFPVFRRHNPRDLNAAYFYYTHKELIGAHDALSDTIATVGVVLGQLEKDGRSFDEAARIENEIDEQEQFDKYLVKREDGGYIMNFGKQKGISLEKIEKSYVQWVLRSDFPQKIKDIIKNYL